MYDVDEMGNSRAIKKNPNWNSGDENYNIWNKQFFSRVLQADWMLQKKGLKKLKMPQ